MPLIAYYADLCTFMRESIVADFGRRQRNRRNAAAGSARSAAALTEPVARWWRSSRRRRRSSSPCSSSTRTTSSSFEPLVGIEQEALAAGHPRSDVSPVRPEDDDRSERHVLTGVVADTLDDGDRTGVAYCE